MDRLFIFIEIVAQENVRIENNIHDDRNRTEKHLLVLMESNFTTIFGQISPEIFKVRFITLGVFCLYGFGSSYQIGTKETSKVICRSLSIPLI